MDFDFNTAQKHELAWQQMYISTVLPEVYAAWRQKKLSGGSDSILSSWLPESLRYVFYDHIKGRTAMEIGCGSIPHLREWADGKRIVIDPLADAYDQYQKKLFGGSFFEGMAIVSSPAENILQEYVGTIDGVIICRNTLDHSEDPLMIMANISKYATRGCYFFFWSDLWHLSQPDAGHKNITKSTTAIEAMILGLGFDKLADVDRQRGSDGYIEYGGIFRKR